MKKKECSQESYETLQEGIKVDELAVPFYVELASIATKLGKVAEAEEVLQKALELDPGHLGAILKYAYILKGQEKYEELITVVERAIDSGEPDTQLLWDLAFAKNN